MTALSKEVDDVEGPGEFLLEVILTSLAVFFLHITLLFMASRQNDSIS